MCEIKRLGNIYGFTGGSFAGNVYDIEGLCPNINTVGGGNRQPMILERTNDDDSDRQQSSSCVHERC